MYTSKMFRGCLAMLVFALASTACVQKRKFDSPKEYDITNPQKIVMPPSLEEISGITFYKGNSDTVYAQEDESGKLYFLKFGEKRSHNFHFGKHGDYEDVAICNNTVIMLKSNGVLYTFPFADIHQEEESGNVKEWKDLLPKGEYEGMYADEKEKLIYIICKDCADEKSSKTGKGYILQLNNDGSISQHGVFEIDVHAIKDITGEKKINFHPSALARNPRTNQWYIITSINKLLVVTDNTWKVTAAYKLNPAIYVQPEGIAFDKDNNLYISNEGGDLHSGNILKIKWTGK
jgi:hypothetical protein